MPLKNRILIIDGDNLCHRVYHKFKGLTTKTGKDSTLIYGVPYLLLSYIKRFNADKIFVAFDGGRSKERIKILPGYKKRDINLALDYEAFYSQKTILKEYLPYINISTIFGDKLEADDLIYRLTRSFSKSSYLTIISSDKDFTQLIKNGISIYNPFKEIIINSYNVSSIMGYSVQEAIDYLILDGDKSDKIPGVKGMGPVKIRKFLDEFISIENYLDNPKGNWDYNAIKVAYKQNNILINLKLYYLKYGKYDTPTIIYPKWDIDIFKKLMFEYNVNLLNNLDNINHFKKLT